MPQMKGETTADLTRLQTYGALYLGNINPEQIEALYVNPGGLFSQIDDTLANIASPSNMGMHRAASMVDASFKTITATTTIVTAVSTAVAATATGVSSAVSSAMGPIGAAVGAVIGIIGTVVTLLLRQRAEAACDSDKCLPKGTGARERRHRRAIVGLNTPARRWEEKEGKCATYPYGGSKNSCHGRRANIVHHTNDGMWWWGRLDGFEDCLNGTVIGVMARVDNGQTAGCHRAYYPRPETPKLPGMPDRPTKDSELSNEFKARQQAVTEVLNWMIDHMSYEVLSCLDNMMHNNTGKPAPHVVCDLRDDICNERQTAKYMRVDNNRHAFPGKYADNRQIASRMYASIRAMFQALVEMSQRIGVGKAKAILASDRVKAPDAAAVLEDVIAEANKPQSQQRPWPEKAIAYKMTWGQLKNALREIALQLREQTESVSRSWGYAFDRVMEERYSINGRSLSPGGIRPTFWYSVGPWVPYAGAGLLAAGAIALVFLADEQEE